MSYRIKENSVLARIAAWKLKSGRIAITMGTTIHLFNTSKVEFLSDERWVRHELKHVEQFKRHGFFAFLWKYTIESIRKGYYNNKFEIEARESE